MGKILKILGKDLGWGSIGRQHRPSPSGLVGGAGCLVGLVGLSKGDGWLVGKDEEGRMDGMVAAWLVRRSSFGWMDGK